MPTTHRLKTLPPFFDAVVRGDKTFEVRKDDRSFQAGDTLVLEHFDPEKEGVPFAAPPVNKPDPIHLRCTYVLRGGQFGIEPGYVVLGISKTTPEN